jgi:hypothetical protein
LLTTRAAENLASKASLHANQRYNNYNNKEDGSCPLQFDAWNVTPTDPARWDALRIRATGLRSSLLGAIHCDDRFETPMEGSRLAVPHQFDMEPVCTRIRRATAVLR